MQTSVETTSNLERRLTFRLPANEVQSKIDGRLREIAQTVRIKGFRPGKVPASVAKQRFGEQVRAEITDELLREGMDSVMQEHKLQIVGRPQVQPMTDAADGEFAFTVDLEIAPDFGDIAVEKLQVVRHTAEVNEEDIDRMIENLRLQRRSWSVVTRAAKDGDALDLETFSSVDGQRLPAEGVENGSTILGSGSVLPALESALQGMRADEEKTVEVSFPENWRVPQLAGKTAQVTAKVVRVSEPVLPEVDADFIKSFGVKSGEMEQFRADIRTNLERELKGALMQRLRREVGEQLIAAYKDIALPPKLVEDEARMMLAQTLQQQAQQTGRAVDNVPENAHEQFKDAAAKRTLVGLLVIEIARRNDLRLDPNRVNETIRLIASTYEEPQQVIDLYRSDRQLLSSLQNRVMEEQVIDWIAERAQHTDTPISFQEAISPLL